MMVVLTNKEVSYLVVGLLGDLMNPLFVNIFVTLSSLAAVFALVRPWYKKGPCLSLMPYSLLQ